LGASGAIFGVVGACAHYPQLKVSLILLPIHSVPISQALPVMMSIDALGLVRNWSMFDHAAHLGGSLFGYAFFPFSQDIIWKNRRKILNYIGIK
jgi:rhomboid-like protein